VRLNRFIPWMCAVAVSTAAALEWKEYPGYRAAPVSVTGTKTGFTELNPAALGIAFTNSLSEARSLTNQIYLNGSGVAAGDVDGDGLCDIYFCGLDSDNALYRNLGACRFENISSRSGVSCAEQASTGAAFADVDGDGDLDLLVNGIWRGTRLFLNDGKANFHEITDVAGIRGGHGSTSLALGDVDGDGLLDLYVVNYRNDTVRDMPDIRYRFAVTNGTYNLVSVNGRPANSPDLIGRFSFGRDSSVLENGEADLLFRNRGNGQFERVSWGDGAFLDNTGKPVGPPYDWGLSAMFRDLNGDGAPDLYVCNDFQSPDRIWINAGAGKFQAGTEQAIRQTSLFSMGVDVADINRDGLDDLFIADMLSPDHLRRQVQLMDAMAYAQFRDTTARQPQFPRNTLFLNRGNGSYSEIAQLAGLDATDWSWCPVFLDVDLDGYEDLLVTTGHWRDAQNGDVSREIEEVKKQRSVSRMEELSLRKRFPRLDTANAAFRNRGDLTFEPSSNEWGFNSRRVSQGMACVDLDNDGDLDLLINALNDAPLIYRNESGSSRIAVRLRGAAPNTRGIGARIRVWSEGLPMQSQEMICGGRYLSSDDSVRVFAARDSARAKIEITWRSGVISTVTNIAPNQIVEIDETSALPKKNGKDETVEPFFLDISARLNHFHQDESFDDFARQPLLPRKLSELGPGVCWFDFNSDGWDDLIIGAGKGGRLAAFRNDTKGGFIPQRAKLLEARVNRDMTTILGWKPNSTNVALLIGLASYEIGGTNAAALREISLVTGEQKDVLPSASSTGPLALGDFDSDGDLDVFVGSRVVPARYPEPASSYLLRNNAGRLELDVEASRPFQSFGLVSSGMFSDLDGDGWPDLIVACEWGALSIFKNKRGTFELWNVEIHLKSNRFSLKSRTGLWTSVAAGDFDNDGRIDLVAGNWGRNSSYERFRTQPIRLFYGESGATGLGLIEARHDPALNRLVPARDLGALSGVFSNLREHFPTFAAFSQAGISDLVGVPPLRDVSAATLDSVVLLNRGDHFEMKSLPIEAQFAPVFGIGVGDLDGDGAQDLFLAQNFFGPSPAESRQDAGCGLWLRGDGMGGFTSVQPQLSGFAIYGEGRGVALSDFDHDGRLDVAVGQNQGATMLYQNVRGRPGFRVQLQGPESNQHAIGARVQLTFLSGRRGPLHEVHLGGGYWSQDSTDLVLALPEDPSELEIRWPDGAIKKFPIPVGSRTMSIASPEIP
jgi:enediyne biosynthesis protein E4